MLKIWPGLLFALFINNAYSSLNGKVVKVRGNVTALFPRTIEAQKLTLGQIIPEDTSIVTGEKSFVRVELSNKSFINIGPSSKLIFKNFPENDPGLLSLLKGQVRAKLKKEKVETKDSKHYFLIKTRSAAIGVRGTELHTIHNPQNKVTSLITYTGDVDMVKIKETPPEKIEKTKKVTDEIIQDKEIKSLESSLNTKDIVQVKSGQLSTSLPAEIKVSKPVQMNPVQLTVLYKNENLDFKKQDVEKEEVEEIEIKKEDLLKQAKQEVPKEGFKNKRTGDFAPRAGGFIDVSSGLYLEPEKEVVAKLDMPKKIGTIDGQTGMYIPPKGLKLDPVEGFVVDTKIKQDKKSFLLAQKKVEELKENVVLNQDVPPVSSSIASWAPTVLEMKSRERMVFSLYSFSHILKTTDHENAISDYRFKTRDAKGLQFDWDQSNGSAWHLTSTLGLRFMKFQDNPRVNDLGPLRYLRMALGAKTYVNERWAINPKILIEQNPYFTTTSSGSSSTNKLTRVTVPKFVVDFSGRYFFGNSWSFSPDIGLFLALPKSFGNMRVNLSKGVNLDAKLNYWHQDFSYFSLGVFVNLESGSASGSEYNFNRDEGGLVLNYTTMFNM